jgi:predicted esterase
LILKRGRYGPDVAAIDGALESTFSRYAVDPARVAVGGYSDGASYALSLGIANGDLFTYVLGFSPGFMAPTAQVGSPRIFVSHGIRDDWLPIERCSRRIVPQLEHAGYDVTYREFEGGHVVPPEIGREAALAYRGKGLNTSPTDTRPPHIRYLRRGRTCCSACLRCPGGSGGSTAAS